MTNASSLEAHDRLKACAKCPVGRFTIYGPTLRDDPNLIARLCTTTQTLEANRLLVRKGDVPRFIHTIFSGWAFEYHQLSDGRRQILSFLVPGDSLALESLASPKFPLPFSARALTCVSLCTFELDAIRRLVRSTPEQVAEFEATFQRYMANQHRRLTDVGRRSASGRLSQLLLELEARLERRGLVKDGTFEFPVRQQHLADALGLTTAYVNRTLVYLRKNNLIAIDRRQLRIIDRKGLAEVAEE
jgi:CRP-like cAMP-binding protein